MYKYTQLITIETEELYKPYKYFVIWFFSIDIYSWTIYNVTI